MSEMLVVDCCIDGGYIIAKIEVYIYVEVQALCADAWIGEPVKLEGQHRTNKISSTSISFRVIDLRGTSLIFGCVSTMSICATSI